MNRVPAFVALETGSADDAISASSLWSESLSSIPVGDANSVYRRGTDRSGHRVACTEVWCSNKRAYDTVKLPGLAVLIYSKPVEPAITGGDVYYLSVCDQGMLSRVVLADVAGHGEAVGAAALELQNLLKGHINTLDQSAVMREINEAFSSESEDLAQYATAIVLSYDSRTGVLVFANAGHPPALWYHANQRTWDWLHEQTPHAVTAATDVPLGLIRGTEYEQTAVRLAEGDLLILYTDGITECTNESTKELGSEGLLRLLRSLSIEPSIATAGDLMAAVEKFRGPRVCFDDQSIIVLQRTDRCLP